MHGTIRYRARGQGGCGSCYAFSATTAISLSTCYLALKEGKRYPHGPPIFSVQDAVACGTSSNPLGTNQPASEAHIYGHMQCIRIPIALLTQRGSIDALPLRSI